MKQELKELRVLASDLAEAKKHFEEKKEVFEVVALFANSNPQYLELEEDVETSYDLANIFYDKFGFVVDYAEALNAEHPRYGEKRFKNTLVEKVISEQGWDYEEDYEKAYYVVSTHMAYEALGYLEVKNAEKEMEAIAEKINATAGVVADQTVNAVKGAGRAVANVFKPYGEVAKGQFEVVGAKTKGAVNKGANKLIKVLEKVANKTASNSEQDN